MVDLRADALRHMIKALKLLDLAGLDVVACHVQLAIDGLAASMQAADLPNVSAGSTQASARTSPIDDHAIGSTGVH